MVSKNTKRPLYNIYKHLSGRHRPGKNVKNIEKLKLYKPKKFFKSRKNLFLTNKSDTDFDYGQNCQKPDLEQKLFNDLKSEFIKNLNKSEKEYLEIERKTGLQADSIEWRQQRKNLLTSSMFGKICKMRSTTSCSSTVKQILYKDFFSKATAWGQNNEERAKQALESKFGFNISKSGLIINKNWPYLRASPDGIEENTDSLIEIKCPFSARNFNINEAISKNCLPYLEIDGESYKLKKNNIIIIIRYRGN